MCSVFFKQSLCGRSKTLTSLEVLMIKHFYRIGRRLWFAHRIQTIIVGVLLCASVWGGARPVFWHRVWDWWTRHHDTFMDALVVAAFVMSLIAHTAIERIRRSTSTRFIGEFPEHLDRITAAIRTAAVRIDGMADCVDYGSFFRPEAFE